MRSSLPVAAALVAATLVGLPAPAGAATTLTWTGTSSTSWTDPANWSPAQIPVAGDSVVIDGGAALNRSIGNVPSLSLQNLTVTTGVDTNVTVTGAGPLTVAGAFSWTGGNLDLPLVVAGTGAVAATPVNPAKFGGSQRTLTVSGELDILGPGAATANSTSSVELMFDSSLVVTSTGRLDLAHDSRILANRCCSSPTSTLTNQGSVRVQGASARLINLGLDQSGSIEVPPGATLEATGGPMRVLGGSMTGGGRVQVVSTSGDSFAPLQPTAPDTTLKLLGDLTLGGGLSLQLDSDAIMSGVGRLIGAGELVLAGGRVRGAVDLGVPVRTVAGTTSRIAIWDNAVAGQHGDLRLGAGGTIAAGSSLAVNGGGRLVVPAGQQLLMQPGATLTSDGCCSNPGQVLVDGTLLVHGQGSPAPELEWVSLSGGGRVAQTGRVVWDLAGTAFTAGAVISAAGTVDGDLPSSGASVQPVGSLAITGDYTPGAAGTLVLDPAERVTVGGTARLGGTLVADGRTVPAGQKRAALTARSVSGRFACARTRGAMTTYSATSVDLVGVPGAPDVCLAPASGKALGATFDGTKNGSLKPPAGATSVLLKVTLKGKGAKLKLKAGTTATVKVAKGKKRVTAYVVLKLGKGAKAKTFAATLNKRAKVSVTQAGYY